ncbi:MAG: hypothetical protein ISS47_08155 [Candidatus Omnitrophica bacterium]|nr:hypothetical protein [Candidatus Omnitrophota bacterium]
MTYINIKIKDWINVLSPLITALATIALVIVTIIYVRLLYNQNALQQDPILKINPNEWSIKGKSQGVFNLTLYNTGVSDVSNIRIFEDYFVPATDNPLALYRVGSYVVIEDQRIDFLEKGKNAVFQIQFKNILEQMTELLKDKKGNQYRIVRLKIKFNREIDKKEFSFNQFYIIAGSGDMLVGEDERGTLGLGVIPLEQIKRTLGNE